MVVSAGVTMLVDAGGTASGTILRGGTEIVSAGGAIVGTTTMSGVCDLTLGARSNVPLTISGFAAGDILHFASFGFGPNEAVSFVENAVNTKGTLTVTDGTLKATITLFGQYVATGFQIASDGTLGSVITNNPTAAPVTPPVLAGKHG
jgi:autotransporter passenger strand-loop-strand repeat protein